MKEPNFVAQISVNTELREHEWLAEQMASEIAEHFRGKYWVEPVSKFSTHESRIYILRSKKT